MNSTLLHCLFEFRKENSLYLEKTSGFILSFIEININFAANFKPYCTSSV